MKTFKILKDQHQEIKLTKPGQYLIELVGSGSSVEITGVFRSQKTEQKKIEVIIHHQAAHTQANTILKGVASDQSFLQLKGKIIINEKCGDTQSFLTERVLLLSEQAKAETVPDLEIKTDDVKCSHAASISSIPEEHLFYLQSRGIKKKTAEEMIVEGFLTI
ncbi:MAG: hypothetical protein COU63_01465 [Candidatus Pacebacteria bacterium CG10_big_fil_rev_8_21_14_0_10_36_11]|nr:SufD family Fe-S cluster assembly protein [Candidatus Pacearchaeota archaeon]OIP73744.1 MAG: hypothetical protein AUK08_04255 [Candidatus Pacebacteria bacterium CG2_30_36_39]PIR64670.1 MAG: hypothetical protein COU63_01465 [Candidatus Pacebacteria bacterium CG10_big_fil_rev_8_21_14_0_10_36_11]PJC42739.1 MAG: hypothetical protein CO040_02845 [Candidatus Pacebacteria bacterium CG_4_9_14_0_2_um_filter_36_8]